MLPLRCQPLLAAAIGYRPLLRREALPSQAMGKRGKGAAQRGDSQGYYTHGSGRGGKGRRSEDQVCKYWQEGQCRYGQQCKFRHDDNTYDDYSHKVAYNQQGPNGRKKRVTASAQSPVVIQLHAPSRRSISGPLDPSYKETAVAGGMTATVAVCKAHRGQGYFNPSPPLSIMRSCTTAHVLCCCAIRLLLARDPAATFDDDQADAPLQLSRRGRRWLHFTQ